MHTNMHVISGHVLSASSFFLLLFFRLEQINCTVVGLIDCILLIASLDNACESSLRRRMLSEAQHATPDLFVPRTHMRLRA